MAHTNISQAKRRNSKGLMATIAIIALVLVGNFGFQIGKATATNSTRGSSSASGGGTTTTSGTPGNNDRSNSTMKKVGILQYVTHPALDQIHKGVVDELKKEGFIDGKNIQIINQNGQGDQSKLATMSQQLVSKRPDALIGIATPAVQALANTTTSIPVMMGAVTNPVATGLVKDLQHPGGNITGVSDKAPADKQIELGTQLLPEAKTVGMLYSSSEDNSKYQVEDAARAAQKQGLKVKKFAVPSSNEIAQTVQVMSGQVDFIYIPLDNTIANAMPTVTQEANKSKTPVITSVDTMVRQGGLATVGVNQYQLGVKTGEMTAKVLRGESKPANTPVYTFKSGDVILNLKQAEFLGINIPSDIRKGATIMEGDRQ